MDDVKRNWVKGIERGIAVLPLSSVSKPPNLNPNITSVYRIDYKLTFTWPCHSISTLEWFL
jgi:hypothetical protein